MAARTPGRRGGRECAGGAVELRLARTWTEQARAGGHPRLLWIQQGRGASRSAICESADAPVRQLAAGDGDRLFERVSAERGALTRATASKGVFKDADEALARARSARDDAARQGAVGRGRRPAGRLRQEHGQAQQAEPWTAAQAQADRRDLEQQLRQLDADTERLDGALKAADELIARDRLKADLQDCEVPDRSAGCSGSLRQPAAGAPSCSTRLSYADCRAGRGRRAAGRPRTGGRRATVDGGGGAGTARRGLAAHRAGRQDCPRCNANWPRWTPKGGAAGPPGRGQRR